MKNSNDTIWDRTSDLRICSTAPSLCHRGPRNVPNLSTNKEDVSFRIVKPNGRKYMLGSLSGVQGVGFQGFV